MISNQWRVSHFGDFKFRHDPRPGNPEHVRILGGWDVANLTTVKLPQLRDMTVCLHFKAVAPFLQLFAAWESAGLLPLVHAFSGAYASRFKRQNGSIEERVAKCATLGQASLSNHAWGTAFDINAPELPLGVAIGEAHPFRQLVPAARAIGWEWGGDYVTRPDPMHFELAR
jgi:hypothetical protein